MWQNNEVQLKVIFPLEVDVNIGWMAGSQRKHGWTDIIMCDREIDAATDRIVSSSICKIYLRAGERR